MIPHSLGALNLLERVSTVGPSPAAVEASADRHDYLATLPCRPTRTARAPWPRDPDRARVTGDDLYDLLAALEQWPAAVRALHRILARHADGAQQ